MALRFTHFRGLILMLLAGLLCSSASAQLPGYASFQTISITNNTSTLVLGYQVPVIFNTQALISTSQLQSTGNDIRFHSSCGGGTLFPHYLDTGLNTTATRIFVKVDSLLPSATRVIYLSYNNPTAANASTLTVFNGPFSSTNQVTGGTAGGVGLSQRGFRFSPNVDILVTQFGKDEPTGTTRTVTLFNYTTTAIVQQGTVSGAAGVYTYNNLPSPKWLTAGTQYVLELFQGASDGYYFGTSTQINSNLTYYDMRYCNSCLATTFPTTVLAGYHYGYPDFNFYTRNTVTPAPTVTLGGSGGSAAAVSITSSPANPICNGGPVVFTAAPINGGTAPTYQWYKNGTAVATGATYSLATPVNGDQIYVTITSNSACATTLTANSNTITLAVSAAPVQPGTITGNATPCTGISQTYSVAAITGATTYTWTVPTGWTITAGQGTVSLTATTSTSNGNISVIASNTTCGNSPARTLPVTVSVTPATPGAIAGNTVVCGTATQTYSIAAVSGATTYNWSLPTGWVITAGGTTNTITVTPAATSGTVNVTAANICGTSQPASLAVTSGTAPAAPGPVTGNTAVCAGSSNTYSVPAIAGLTYNWTVPSGWTFTQANNTITAVAGSTGNVTVSAANGTCGSSTPTAYPVTVNPVLTPAVTISNTSAGNSICSGTFVTFTANGTGGGPSPSYQWKVNGVNVGPNAPTYMTNSLQNGDVVTVVLTAVYPCLTAPTATSAPATFTVIPTVTPGININTTPPTIFCAGSTLTFTTTSTGGGANPTYQWYKNNLPITGVTTPNYTTSALANNDTISVKITSSSTCASVQSMFSNKVGLTVQQNVVPTIHISASPSTNVAAGTPVTFTATFTDGGTTPTIQWMKNGSPVPFATNTTYSTSSLQDGDLVTAILTSYAPCANPIFVTAAPLRMSIPTGINHQASTGGGWEGNISLYPNPNSGRFTISCDWGAGHRAERVTIEIVNAVGQRVYANELTPNASQWSLPVWLGDVANGLYQLRIHTETMRTVRGISVQR